MIKATCEKCNKEIKPYGALIFSPPENLISKEVLKFHICLGCYSKLCDWLEEKIQ